MVRYSTPPPKWDDITILWQHAQVDMENSKACLCCSDRDALVSKHAKSHSMPSTMASWLHGQIHFTEQDCNNSNLNRLYIPDCVLPLAVMCLMISPRCLFFQKAALQRQLCHCAVIAFKVIDLKVISKFWGKSLTAWDEAFQNSSQTPKNATYPSREIPLIDRRCWKSWIWFQTPSTRILFCLSACSGA